MGFPWDIKESFMDHVRGGQEEHPYVVGLKSSIEEKLRECCEKEFVFVGSRC